MNRRTFLKGSLAAIGALVVLPKTTKASEEILEAYDFTYDGTKWEERNWCSRAWAEKQYEEGNAYNLWAPNEVDEMGHIIRSSPNFLFLNMKNGENYICSVWYTGGVMNHV